MAQHIKVTDMAPLASIAWASTKLTLSSHTVDVVFDELEHDAQFVPLRQVRSCKSPQSAFMASWWQYDMGTMLHPAKVITTSDGSNNRNTFVNRMKMAVSGDTPRVDFGLAREHVMPFAEKLGMMEPSASAIPPGRDAPHTKLN